MLDRCTCRPTSIEPCSYCDYASVFCVECHHENCPDDCFCDCNENSEEE